MGLLFLLSYVSICLQVSFAVVAVAAALYYLAELVEEFTVMAKKVIMLLILATGTIYLGLMVFDNLPWGLILTGFAAQGVHAWIMKSFPYVRIVSPEFVIAVILVVVQHFLAFKFFSKNYYPLTEVLAFFTLCLWIVPFALFVSLSANDQVLPTTMSPEQSPLLDNSDVVTSYFSRKKKSSLLSLFNYAKDSLLPQRSKKAF